MCVVYLQVSKTWRVTPLSRSRRSVDGTLSCSKQVNRSLSSTRSCAISTESLRIFRRNRYVFDVDLPCQSSDCICVTCSARQVHTFYEAVGYMISAQPHKAVQERLIEQLMKLPNDAVSRSTRRHWLHGSNSLCFCSGTL